LFILKEVRNGEEWLEISYLVVIAEFLSTYKTRIEGEVTGSIPYKKKNRKYLMEGLILFGFPSNCK
jgi:hypothetical protein